MLHAVIIGNLGNDAEIKEINGRNYVSFNVAHTEKKRDARGNLQEYTTWVSVLWYGDGRAIMQYLRKGSKVFVWGRLSVKTYQDKNGYTQVALNVNASEVQLCGVKGEGQQASAGYAPPTSRQAAPVQQQKPVNYDNDLPWD